MLVKVIKEFCMSFQKKHIVILGIMMIACFVCYGSSHLEHWCYLSWANAAEFWLVFGLLFGEHLYFLGIPKVFFYVPQANGGIRSYIRMRILAETLLYFIVTLILMLATCALQMGEEVKFYTGQLQWQIPGAVLLFLLLLRWRTAVLCRMFTGREVPSASKWVRVLHVVMVVLNFLMILFCSGHLEYILEKGDVQVSIRTTFLINLPMFLTEVLSVLSGLYIIWYVHSCICSMTGAEVRNIPRNQGESA